MAGQCMVVTEWAAGIPRGIRQHWWMPALCQARWIPCHRNQLWRRDQESPNLGFLFLCFFVFVFFSFRRHFSRVILVFNLRCIRFLGPCNKLPQTRWLKLREIYSLTVVEARILKWRLRQDHASSKGSRGGPVLVRFRSGSSRQGFLGWWWRHSNLSLHLTWLSPSSLCAS